jgi:hypothetical protein
MARFRLCMNAVECMIIDFFDFHSKLYPADKISSQQHQLMEEFMSMISDMFGFSSLSHFSRYVQTNLGAKPSDFRE